MAKKSYRQAINEAVREAESQTSAEIMTVVATDSGRYDRPEDSPIFKAQKDIIDETTRQRRLAIEEKKVPSDDPRLNEIVFLRFRHML